MKPGRPTHYILAGHRVVPVYDVLTWARWFEHAGAARIVKQEEVAVGFFVSTVFLGLDYAFHSGPPRVFETMAFRHGEEFITQRCATWEQAETQHEAVMLEVRNTIQERKDEPV